MTIRQPSTMTHAVLRSQAELSLAQRLPYFDSDNSLEADAHIVRDAMRGRERDVVDIFWTHYWSCKPASDRIAPSLQEELSEKGVAYVHEKFDRPRHQRWADIASDHARQSFEVQEPLGIVLASFEISHRHMIRIITEVLGDDAESIRRASSAVFRLAILEADIMTATLGALLRDDVARIRTANSDLFRDQIASGVSEASDLGTQLRSQAINASAATRGMLGKTSEVAAAAEQSAMAMRDAAHTAAGLIRAIEDARLEVETAAEVATRAAEQADTAVKVSETLSDTAKSIESILGLIRDVAGQTNLLALNATIEAARAGDAGRGFAVVAQEVKSLANQTARATDDIEAKISAIQSATRSTVDSNGSIRDIVTEVQASANRIRSAMEMQAQTVTMITAAVDETALAADTMSTTIAAIRADTEEVATEIDSLGGGFDSVNAKLLRLQDAAGEYVKMVA